MTWHRQIKAYNPRGQLCAECKDGMIEDQDHVLRCSHPSREKWRDQLVAAITTKCVNLKSDPQLTQIMTKGLHQWLQGNDKGQEVWSFPAKYRWLVQEQNAIGWRQFFNGRVSKEWARLQDDYAFVRKQREQDLRSSRERRKNDTTSTCAYTGTRWTSEIINEIWVQWKIVWTQRNETIHGHDSRMRVEKMHQRDALRLQHIYDNREQMEPSVRELLFETIEEHQIHCSKPAINNWLAIHESTFIQSVKNVAKRALHGVRSIQSYFHKMDGAKSTVKQYKSRPKSAVAAS